MKKALLLILAIPLIFIAPSASASDAIDTSAINNVVVQEDGRLKPFLTLAS